MKSKKIFLITMLFFIFALTSAHAAKPNITADKTYYDYNTGLYILEGNVRVEVRNRLITAQSAKVSVSSMEVWAAGGIFFQQDDISFTGGNLYVYGGKQLAKIDGGANYSAPNLKISADRGEYNWDSKIAVFSGNVTVNENGTVRQADTVCYNMVTKSFI
ncbi:MAG: organic solvent tolerance protein OstA [Sporomusaceae bacterium]|jgi:lipopolysaccharide assembly outer membrane protein LptD (OstA)|nr:organic solvent tolerance protein OstA [Sporomusaceae bacterium]